MVAQTGGSNPYSLQNFAQPDFEENVVSAADVSTQTEQQIEINEQQSSKQQKVNRKTIIILYQSYRKTLIRSILIIPEL